MPHRAYIYFHTHTTRTHTHKYQTKLAGVNWPELFAIVFNAIVKCVYGAVCEHTQITQHTHAYDDGDLNNAGARTAHTPICTLVRALYVVISETNANLWGALKTIFPPATSTTTTTQGDRFCAISARVESREPESVPNVTHMPHAVPPQ